jgi:hypothetical protein
VPTHRDAATVESIRRWIPGSKGVASVVARVLVEDCIWKLKKCRKKQVCGGRRLAKKVKMFQ